MIIKNVTIAGGGTLGSQIAWQTAFSGFNVVVYDAFEKGIEASKTFHKVFANLFMEYEGVSLFEETEESINYSYNSFEVNSTNKSYNPQSLNVGLGFAYSFGKGLNK